MHLGSDCVIADRGVGFDDVRLSAQGNKDENPDEQTASAACHGCGSDHGPTCTCTDTLAPIDAEDGEGGGTALAWYVVSFGVRAEQRRGVVKWCDRRNSDPTPGCATGER